MLAFAILVALTNGLLVGLSRALNGALGRRVGVIGASLWNHAVGFCFLSIAAIAAPGARFLPLGAAPAWTWLGGVVGVAFVATNSYVIVRAGAARTAGLVVSGQMLASVVIASLGAPIDRSILVRLLGAALVIAGAVLARREPKARETR
jgi:transporter family-2 protein